MCTSSATVNIKQLFKSPPYFQETTGNKVGQEGARALSKALRTNTTLTRLELGSSFHIQTTRREKKRTQELNQRLVQKTVSATRVQERWEMHWR